MGFGNYYWFLSPESDPVKDLSCTMVWTRYIYTPIFKRILRKQNNLKSETFITLLLIKIIHL